MKYQKEKIHIISTYRWIIIQVNYDKNDSPITYIYTPGLILFGGGVLGI